jgi:hypothetical protein
MISEKESELNRIAGPPAGGSANKLSIKDFPAAVCRLIDHRLEIRTGLLT